MRTHLLLGIPSSMLGLVVVSFLMAGSIFFGPPPGSGHRAQGFSVADAACTPSVINKNQKVDVLSGAEYWQYVFFDGSTNTAFGVAKSFLYSFDRSSASATIPKTTVAGKSSSASWSAPYATGTNAYIPGITGALMKTDASWLLVATATRLFGVTLSGNFPIADVAGSGQAICTAQKSGTAAQFKEPNGMQWKDVSETSVVMNEKLCNYIGDLSLPSGYWTYHTGDGTENEQDGFGGNAKVKNPRALAHYRNRFFLTSGSFGKRISTFSRVTNYIGTISTPSAAAATSAGIFNFYIFLISSSTGSDLSFHTWDNCYLQIYHNNIFNLIDVEGTQGSLNGFRVPMAAGSADGTWAARDPSGQLWIATYGGSQYVLQKHTISYTGCTPASPSEALTCAWATPTSIPTQTIPVGDNSTGSESPATAMPSDSSSSVIDTTTAAATTETSTSAAVATTSGPATTTAAATTAVATPSPPVTGSPTATVMGTSGTPSPTAGSLGGSPGGHGGVGGATASGASSSSSLGASVGACHYTKVSWPLTEGIRHRMEFNWGSTFTLCNFVFSCPKTTTGIAFKMTKVVPLGSFLSVAANASSYDATVYNRLNALTYLSSSDDVDLMVDAKMALKITGWGTGGSFAVQATCMTEPQVPQNGAEVNYVTKALYTKYSTNYHSSLDTYSKIHRAFRPYALYRRRAYGELENRAFMISCKTSDMTTNNLVVQLKEVIGTTGSGGDVLKITAVDSGNNTVYQAGTIHSTYARTNDTNVFSASSQYYVTWTSDNINETSTGLTISYYCGEAPWVLSGIGNSVSSDPGSGNGASGLGSVWAAALAALAILTLG